MRVLLTGATGFLGSHLLKRLLDLKYEVIILKRSFSNTWRINEYLNMVTAYDIDKTDLKKVFQSNKIDMILHSATNQAKINKNIASIVESNIYFPIRLLQCAIDFQITRFINIDTLLPKDINSYALSKKQFVEWLKISSKDSSVKVINFKLEHLYGPMDDETKFINWLISQMLRNVKEINLTKGIQKRDFIYVEDAVAAILMVVNKQTLDKKFQEFDVATGKQISIKDFVEKTYSIVKSKQNINSILNFGKVPYREGELMEVHVNINPLLSLGWHPIVSLEEGLNTVIEEKILNFRRE